MCCTPLLSTARARLEQRTVLVTIQFSLSNFGCVLNNPFFSLGQLLLFSSHPTSHQTKLWWAVNTINFIKILPLNTYLFNILYAKWEMHTKHLPRIQKNGDYLEEKHLCDRTARQTSCNLLLRNNWQKSDGNSDLDIGLTSFQKWTVWICHFKETVVFAANDKMWALENLYPPRDLNSFSVLAVHTLICTKQFTNMRKVKWW